MKFYESTFDDYLQETKKVPFHTELCNFENSNFNCPQQEKLILESLFGDYNQLPPIDQRRVHAIDIRFFD